MFVPSAANDKDKTYSSPECEEKIQNKDPEISVFALLARVHMGTDANDSWNFNNLVLVSLFGMQNKLLPGEQLFV